MYPPDDVEMEVQHIIERLSREMVGFGRVELEVTYDQLRPVNPEELPMALHRLPAPRESELYAIAIYDADSNAPVLKTQLTSSAMRVLMELYMRAQPRGPMGHPMLGDA